MSLSLSPIVTWLGSPNFHPDLDRMVFCIVDHVMQGTLAGTDAWFAQSISQVSSHFGVGKNGEIHQYVREEDQAWHAGVIYLPTARVVKSLAGVNPNRYTIGIEHEGLSGEELTPAQFQATLALHQYLLTKYRIPPSSDRIVRHSTIDALHVGCPGPGFPMDYLIQTLKGQDPCQTNESLTLNAQERASLQDKARLFEKWLGIPPAQLLQLSAQDTQSSPQSIPHDNS